MKTLPRDDLVRALRPGPELRADEDGGLPTLFGHFAVFNRWTEIDSLWEGNFLERIAPGAFKKTFRENRDQIKSLFQHGHDPQIGDKPLGPFDELKEDDVGAYYEVPLLDTTYNRDLVPGLEAGLYGASFRFRVMREEVEEEPEASADNPKGLPERTIKEARVYEGGPVTFPAYPEASAGVRDGMRSLTDEFIFSRLSEDPERLAAFINEHGRDGIFVPRSLPDLEGEPKDQDVAPVVVADGNDDEGNAVAIPGDGNEVSEQFDDAPPSDQEPADATPDPEDAATDEDDAPEGEASDTDETEDDGRSLEFWFVGREDESDQGSLKMPPRGGFYLFA